MSRAESSFSLRMDSGTTVADKLKIRRWRKYLQEHPEYFVRKYIKAEPTDQQLQVLRKLPEHELRLAIKSGHGVGKSTVLAWTIIWFISLFDRAKVLATAPTAIQLEDVLWTELQYWHANMHPWFNIQLRWTSTKFFAISDPTQVAWARTSRKENPVALQGRHSGNLLLIVDEASGVDDVIYESARGSFSTPGAKAILASNPTRAEGYFHKVCTDEKTRWTVFTFSSLDSPLVSPSFAKDIAEEFGEDSDIYRVRVLGEFPKQSAAQLIPTELVETAVKRKILEKDVVHAPLVYGIDTAWEGDDKSVFVKRKGLHSDVVGAWRGLDHMLLADVIAEAWNRERPDAVFIDAAMSAGLIDRLRQLGFSPTPVYFGGKPLDQKRYINKRTEMWVKIKNWLEQGGAIPNEKQLKEDLIGPVYFFSPAGKMALERKKDMKSRGLKSPDYGDALALTFAADVWPAEKPYSKYDNEAHMGTGTRDYDPLDMER